MPTNGRITISADRVLHISSLFSTDEGSYTCVVSNSQGSVSANTLLSVLGEWVCASSLLCMLTRCKKLMCLIPGPSPYAVIPVIHAGVTLVTVNEGETAILDCNATGSPTPTVSWFHSSLPVPILGETRIQQADNDSLIVTSVSGEDGGVYVCQAQNIAGSETATLELVVNGEQRRGGCVSSITSPLTLLPCSPSGAGRGSSGDIHHSGTRLSRYPHLHGRRSAHTLHRLAAERRGSPH